MNEVLAADSADVRVVELEMKNMNNAKLKAAEAEFMERYPGGFSNPRMLEIAKKHKVEKMKQMAQDSFAPNHLIMQPKLLIP